MGEALTTAIAQLALQLSHEYQALATLQRYLAVISAYEETHGDTGQLRALRQECAATHCRILEIERRLADAQARRRTLSGYLGHGEGRN